MIHRGTRTDERGIEADRVPIGYQSGSSAQNSSAATRT